MTSYKSHNDWNTRVRTERRRMCYNILGNKCARCSNQFDHYDFDHMDPSTKLFTISNILMAPMPKLLAEIQKCQLLCKDCHKEKTKEERGSLSHGINGYNSRKCRCDICKKTTSEYRLLHPVDRTKKKEKFFGSYL